MANVKMIGDDVEEAVEDVPEEVVVKDVTKDDDLEEEAPDFGNEDEPEYEDDIQALSDVPPDTEIWTGGPTAGTMLKWREDYKNVYVTSISFDEHVAWRPLLRKEYALVSRQVEAAAAEMIESEVAMFNEELICRICVLFPDYSKADFDDILAGIPTLISQQILERSGFSAVGLREML